MNSMARLMAAGVPSRLMEPQSCAILVLGALFALDRSTHQRNMPSSLQATSTAMPRVKRLGRHSSHIAAKPKKAKKPTTSVTVVTNTPEAGAGSRSK